MRVGELQQYLLDGVDFNDKGNKIISTMSAGQLLPPQIKCNNVILGNVATDSTAGAIALLFGLYPSCTLP